MGSLGKSATRHVLVIVAGGTIIMEKGKAGLGVPLGCSVSERLRNLPIFKKDESDPDLRVLNFHQPEPGNVIFKIMELKPLIDSSNATIENWKSIAKCIEKHYKRHDGFVILYGTDTMAYLGSALSFMLETLTKPVVITGSQIPIFETRNDGRENLINSLNVAGKCNIPEVLICFHGNVLRANRTVKWSSTDFDAFCSPHVSPIVTFGTEIKLNNQNHDTLNEEDSNRELSVCTSFEPKVAILYLYPNISIDVVKAQLNSDLKGLVLYSFGSGNIPSSNEEFMRALANFQNSEDKFIVNVSQCGKGKVTSTYAAAALAEAGPASRIDVINGRDMTCEAAYCKLLYVLGKKDWNKEKKEKMLKTSLKKEMTEN